MRWRYVATVGFVLAGGLFVAATHETPAVSEGPGQAAPYYLLWAAMATVGVTVTAAFLVQSIEMRPRSRPAIARSALGVLCALALLGLGEAAVYVAERPSTMDARLAAQTSAFQLFVGGVLGISAAAVCALIVINRRERRAPR